MSTVINSTTSHNHCDKQYDQSQSLSVINSTVRPVKTTVINSTTSHKHCDKQYNQSQPLSVINSTVQPVKTTVINSTTSHNHCDIHYNHYEMQHNHSTTMHDHYNIWHSPLIHLWIYKLKHWLVIKTHKAYTSNLLWGMNTSPTRIWQLLTTVQNVLITL